VVRDFATRYFELPKNHTSIVADALSEMPTMQKSTKTYNFIVHDVFTGGTEPIELFTFEFISDLRKLLKDGGSIAIVSPHFERSTTSSQLIKLNRITGAICDCPRPHRS